MFFRLYPTHLDLIPSGFWSRETNKTKVQTILGTPIIFKLYLTTELGMDHYERSYIQHVSTLSAAGPTFFFEEQYSARHLSAYLKRRSTQKLEFYFVNPLPCLKNVMKHFP